MSVSMCAYFKGQRWEEGGLAEAKMEPELHIGKESRVWGDYLAGSCIFCSLGYFSV